MGDESPEVREVREVAARYVDAVYRGDVASLRGLFHPSAVMSGYLGEELVTGGPERFFEDLSRTPSMLSGDAPYATETVSAEVVGDVASLRIDETGFFGSLAFCNWFHLIKNEGGEWLIVSKLFTVRPSREGPPPRCPGSRMPAVRDSTVMTRLRSLPTPAGRRKMPLRWIGRSLVKM
jgi:hypothetical protein